MKDFLRQLFSDSGDVSMMRIMALLCLLAGIILAFVGINKTPIDYSGIAILVGVFLGAAFTGKVTQKSVELNAPKVDTPPPKVAPPVVKPKVDNPD
jgi:hypothetical protein